MPTSPKEIFEKGADPTETAPTYIGNQDQLSLSSEELARSDYMIQKHEIASSEISIPNLITDKNNTVAGTIASILYKIDDSRPYEDYYLEATDKISTMGEQNTIDQTVNEYEKYYESIVKDMLIEAANALEDPMDAVSDANEVLNENALVLHQPDNLEAAQVLALSGQDNQEAAELMYYQRSIADLLEGTTIWEDITNFAGIFWPDWHWDTADLTGQGILNAEESLKTMIFNFQAMPIEKRLAIWPKLVRDVMEAVDGNELEAASKLMAFIDPTTEHSAIDTEAFLEKLDYGLIAAPMLWGIAKGVKGYRTLNNIKRAGDTDTAAKINAAALSDDSGQIAEQIGTDRHVAAMNTSPINYEEMGIAEATDGLAADTARTIEEMHKRRQAVQESLAPILDKNNYLFEESLTEAERRLVQEKAINKVEDLQEEYYKAYGHYPSGAKIVEHGDESFTIEYELAGVPQTKTVKYVQNDVGTFDTIEAHESSNFWSPSVWMDKIQKDAVEVATRIGFQQSKLLGDLTRAAKLATKGLSSKSKSRVDDVLLAGDDYNMGKGANFSIQDLKAGVPTRSGLITLSDEEIASYYAHRDIFNALHFMKEGQVYRTLEFKGFKEVLVDGREAIAKPLRQQDLPESIKVKDDEFLLYDVRGPYGDGTSGVVNASTIDVEDLYNKGYFIVRFKDPVKFGDDALEYAVVNETKDLRRVGLLNKRKGYVPKVAKEGYYFVKQVGDTMLNGKPSRGGDVRTLRMFDNRREAEEYAAQQAAEGDGTKQYLVKHDREISMAELEEEFVNEAGGLFTSARAKHDITYGLKGDTPARLSATEAMERNLTHISNNIPMNEFRLGIQQRWLNSARGHLVHEGDFNSPLKDEIGTPAYIGLTKSREWIRDQLRIPTESERRWAAFARTTAEWMEGKPLISGKPRKLILDSARQDPFSNLRAYSFHALLGWFNPAQLWVQAQGASIALSLDPLGAPATIANYLAFRAAWFGRGNPELVAKAAKAAGMDGDELVQMMKEIERTGIMDSVRTTADYAAAEKGFGIDRGTVKRIADGGLMFFREGEMFTRGYAYLSARRQWLKANPGKAIDNDAIKEIVKDSLKRMMNLNRANRAQWQKGAISVPLQFKQVFAKFAENMLGKTGKWSDEERLKVMLGQAVLYGAAGIPLGDTLAVYLAESLGESPGSLSKEQVAFIEDGLWGYLSELALDTQFELGTRGSLVDGFNSLVNAILIDDAPTELYETALGPFFTIPNRLGNAVKTIAPMMAHAHEIDWTQKEAYIALSSIADVASSWNNAHKAWVWHSLGEVRNSKGQTIFTLDKNEDFNLILGKAFGFTPARINDFYETRGFNLNYKKMMQEKAQSLVKAALPYYTSKMTQEDLRNLQIKQEAILVGLSPVQKVEVNKMAAKLLLNSKDEEAENLRKAMKIYLDSQEIRPGKGVLGGDDITFNTQLNKEAE